ncbi:nurim homolog [Schistocerca gregaria]|uniref:nurim homolog n=1 Tax=Schistocerca gregaria TaxID=7010 RepID=UPI00211EF712|nr:nurim homolog [Schistocerca gregaria]XP_049861226.1 nurim homolog [Schistocerca gregaria]
MKLRDVFHVSFSFFSFLFSAVTFIQLIFFLSHLPKDEESHLKDDIRGFEDAIWPLLVDLALLYLFVLQHSVMAEPYVKDFFVSHGASVIQRSIYVLLSSVALQVVFHYWQYVPWLTLWQIDTTQSSVKLWCFAVIHCCAWIMTYAGVINMDVLDLLGVKQVYFDINGWGQPDIYKSAELRRFYQHMRHPTFLGFLTIFWLYPIMSIDRLLLAFVWTGYMIIGWNVDRKDLLYIKKQFNNKMVELSPNKCLTFYERSKLS